MRLSKKIVAAALVATGTFAATGAYAYWTTSGSGTGTAATTAGVVNQLGFVTSGIDAMFPGDSVQNETVTVTNNSGESAYVANVKAYVTTDKAGCTGADFLLQGSSAGTAASPTSLTWTAQDLAAAGSGDAGFSIQFNNKASASQDACKGAVVTLNYSAS